MTKKMQLVLHKPTTNREKRILWKGSPDGVYVPTNQKMEVQLHPGRCSYDEGKKRFVAHIDAEKWLQITPTGAGAWVGPDPRLQMAQRVLQIRRALQTRGVNWEKFLWPIVIFVLGIMAALILMPVLILGQQ